MNLLIIDVFDSFTYNLMHICERYVKKVEVRTCLAQIKQTIHIFRRTFRQTFRENFRQIFRKIFGQIFVQILGEIFGEITAVQNSAANARSDDVGAERRK